MNTEFSAVFPVGVNSISGHSLDREPKQALWQRYAVSSVENFKGEVFEEENPVNLPYQGISENTKSPLTYNKSAGLCFTILKISLYKQYDNLVYFHMGVNH